MFGVLCLHEARENRGMTCPLRCGQRRLEYNPELTGRMSDTELEECLRAEAVYIYSARVMPSPTGTRGM